MIHEIKDILGRIMTRIGNLHGRAVVQNVSDAPTLQKLQLEVLKDVPAEDAERFQQYGFSSVPLAGAEAVVMFPGGDYGLPLVIAVDDRRYRPIGKPGGEVAIYTDEGDEVRLSRGHIVFVKTSGKVILGGTDPALGDNPLAGVATGQSVDGWGMPLHLVSTTVFAKP